MKNRQVFKGKVNSQNEFELVMTTPEGKKLNFSKKTILKVLYKDLNENEVKKVIQEEEIKQGITAKDTPGKKDVPGKKDPEPDTSGPKSPEVRSKWMIAWRSAVVPGWGQLKAKRYWTASAAFLVPLGIAGYLGSTYKNYQDAEKQYQSKAAFTALATGAATSSSSISTTTALFLNIAMNNSAFSPYEAAKNTFNNTAPLLGVAYALQLAHAYYVGKQWEVEGTSNAVTIDGKSINEGWSFNASMQRNIFSGQLTPNFEMSYAIHFKD
ncbi:MAG TPA: DUF5683 domain-containing protein [Leptospiraceae bacterium]|nr:DUF5683 domain-containing protein [Leptospiraceae bacterium]HMY69071.1 DUF5683 domain-containing protein [Leptospiraceae bacterium]HMZ58205.1 DUF5683 domain-containing protein [Leptospiraceae bacterium]HNF12293.1 DUF5683 domain-containing protein [Leptospiraceae bacterium]HNF25363.1 DUF5683 domain-containing protein [Leptospiraceae bacterium]